MKPGHLILAILGVGILINSCTTYITYPIQTPPAIKTDKDINRIAFINRFDYTSLTFDNENKSRVIADGARILIGALESSFAADENFQFIVLDTLKKGLARTDLPGDLSFSGVAPLCEGSKADLLLILESFNPFFDIETETTEDEDGRSTTNYVDLVVEAGFSLYRSNGELLDRAMVTEITHYQARPALSRFIVIGPSMGKAGVKVNELSGRIGEGYIYNFYPGTESAMRMIYIGGPFSGVTTLMRNHWWEDAIELLMPLASSPDPKIAQKAAHNLAIAYEGMGDRDAYIFWTKKKNE